MAYAMTASPSMGTGTFDLAPLKSSAASLGVDWIAVWQDIIKYGPGLVSFALAIAGDIAAGNLAKVLTDLFSMGPAELQAIIQILKDLGITLPIP